MARRANIQKKTNPVLAAVMAWAVPGAGHLYLGRPVRAAILFAVIQLMFWSGIAIGGVFTVNPRDEFWWFNGQMLTGASGVASWRRQRQTYARVSANVADRLAAMPAPAGDRDRELYARAQIEVLDEELARQNLALVPPAGEIPLMLSGLAGMLNLMCVFDAVMLSLMGRYGEPKPEERS